MCPFVEHCRLSYRLQLGIIVKSAVNSGVHHVPVVRIRFVALHVLEVHDCIDKVGTCLGDGTFTRHYSTTISGIRHPLSFPCNPISKWSHINLASSNLDSIATSVPCCLLLRLLSPVWMRNSCSWTSTHNHELLSIHMPDLTLSESGLHGVISDSWKQNPSPWQNKFTFLKNQYWNLLPRASNETSAFINFLFFFFRYSAQLPKNRINFIMTSSMVIACLLLGAVLSARPGNRWVNDFDEPFNFACPFNESIIGVEVKSHVLLTCDDYSTCSQFSICRHSHWSSTFSQERIFF